MGQQSNPPQWLRFMSWFIVIGGIGLAATLSSLLITKLLPLTISNFTVEPLQLYGGVTQKSVNGHLQHSGKMNPNELQIVLYVKGVEPSEEEKWQRSYVPCGTEIGTQWSLPPHCTFFPAEYSEFSVVAVLVKKDVRASLPPELIARDGYELRRILCQYAYPACDSCATCNSISPEESALRVGPTETPTPTLIPPVALEGPEKGFRSDFGERVELRWSCTYVLQDEESYRLSITGWESYFYSQECHFLSTFPPGEYEWTVTIVRRVDSSEDVLLSEESGPYSFEVAPPSPIVHSILPTSMIRGTSVQAVISGENFTHSHNLTIGIPLQTTFVDSQTIMTTIPITLEVGEHPVIVKNSMGEGDSSAVLTVKSCSPQIEWVDLPIPEGTTIWPGTHFTKSWSLTSANLCPWPEGSKLVYVKGEIDGPDEQEIGSLMAPTETVTVSVPLTAPEVCGEYDSTWQIQNADGYPISEELGVSIIVAVPPPVYSKPKLDRTEVSRGCNVTFYWSWDGTLKEDEYFAVRAGIGDPRESRVWTKETKYQTSLAPPCDYVWEVAVCKGDPATHICEEELVVSEQSDPFFIGNCPGDWNSCPPCPIPPCPPCPH